MVQPARVTALGKALARELSQFLGILYPGNRYRISDTPPRNNPSILLGTLEDPPGLSKYVSRIEPDSRTA